MGFRQLVQKFEQITSNISTLRANEMNGYLMGFRQLAQKFERLTSNISTLQDKQNEWSFCEFSSTGSKVGTNNMKQKFYSSRQTK